MTISTVISNYYRIPLPSVLTDSTHGKLSSFEIICVRIQDKIGNEGLGYTFTVGSGGAAIKNIIDQDLTSLLINEDENRIENLWQKMWWFLHYTGRGGTASFAMAAVDIALWDLKARKQETSLWRLLGGHDPRVKAYAGGIDLYFTLEELLEQTQQNLDKGFKAIKMKVGRENLSEDLERVSAMRNFLGKDFLKMIFGLSVSVGIVLSIHYIFIPNGF